MRYYSILFFFVLVCSSVFESVYAQEELQKAKPPQSLKQSPTKPNALPKQSPKQSPNQSPKQASKQALKLAPAAKPKQNPLDESAYISNVNNIGEEAYNGKLLNSPLGENVPALPIAPVHVTSGPVLKQAPKQAPKQAAKQVPKQAAKQAPKQAAKQAASLHPSPHPTVHNIVLGHTLAPTVDPDDYPHAEEAEADEEAETDEEVEVDPFLLPGESLLIFICNFHVLSHLLLIYICNLHWNRRVREDERN